MKKPLFTQVERLIIRDNNSFDATHMKIYLSRKKLQKAIMKKLIELFAQAVNAFKKFVAFEKAEKKSIVLSPEQKESLEMWRKAAKEIGVTAQQAANFKKITPIILILSLCSCYHQSTVKTVVVAEKLTKKGNYLVICSDGYNTYKISPFSRIPLGQRVDMDTKTHTFRIVGDLNGRVQIGLR